MITEGSAEVESGDSRVATLGAGTYFGEIALLRDIPRTATVRAGTDLELLALERADFLDAVTGSRRSARVASSQVDQRLTELGEAQA